MAAKQYVPEPCDNDSGLLRRFVGKDNSADSRSQQTDEGEEPH